MFLQLLNNDNKWCFTIYNSLFLVIAIRNEIYKNFGEFMEFLENFRAFVWKIPDKILDDFSGIM